MQVDIAAQLETLQRASFQSRVAGILLTVTATTMRILHLLNHCEDIGNGIVNCAVDIACEQAEMGHQVHVASGGGEFESLLYKHNVGHHAVPQRARFFHSLKILRPLRRVLDHVQPDVVHCHMVTGVLLAKTLRAHRCYSILSHVHNIYQRTSVLMGSADRVIVVSRSSVDILVDRGISREKIRVVTNGIIGGARGEIRPDLAAIPLQHPAIVTVAGMYYRKGILELMQAFNRIADRFPAAHLYLVGDGPDYNSLHRYAQTLSIRERIHFEGFQRNPQPYMAAADVFVLASRRESLPLVLLEAREIGCPIISTDVDGCPEALDYGAAGRLVKLGDVEQLADTIAECIGDKGVGESMRQAALARNDHLTVRRMATEVMDVYSEVLPHRSTPAFSIDRQSRIMH